MPLTLDSITTGATRKPFRGILLGVEKIGKSTFAAGAESPIFLPIRNEEGIDEIDVPRFPSLTTFGEVVEAINVLRKDQRHDFQTVVLDSSSALEPLIIKEAMRLEGATSAAKLGGGYGRQDDTPCKLWLEICEGLTALRDERGMNSIIIGHVKVRAFNDPLTDPYDTWEWDVRQAARSALFRWCDWIWFCNRKASTVKTEAPGGKERVRAVGRDDRYLFTQKRPSHPGGGRGIWGHLPAELPLSWSAVNDALAKLESPTTDKTA